MEVTPLSAALGAEIGGLNLRENLDTTQVARIREALHTHQVLVFRDQALSPQQHISFARRFGPIKCPPVATRHGGPAEINVLDQKQPRGEGADNWHADNTYTATPPMGSILHAVRMPTLGGDTAFASMHAAYQALSPAMRGLCERLTAVHDVTRSITKAIRRGHSSADLESVRRQLPPVEHPVVVAHPETGLPSLFVNVNSTTRIRGMSETESGALLGFLFEHVKQPEFQLRVRWWPDTVVFLDNRCTQHYALADYHERRVVHRVAIEGERPRALRAMRPPSAELRSHNLEESKNV